jgi:hypothetical protein
MICGDSYNRQTEIKHEQETGMCDCAVPDKRQVTHRNTK